MFALPLWHCFRSRKVQESWGWDTSSAPVAGRHRNVNPSENACGPPLPREVREFGVKPEIECFELGHIYFAKQLAKEGIIDDPMYVQLCMGVRPAERRLCGSWREGEKPHSVLLTLERRIMPHRRGTAVRGKRRRAVCVLYTRIVSWSAC